MHIEIRSPFEKWLENEQRKQLEPSKELRSPDATLADANWIQDAELVPVEIKQEFNHIDKQLIKRKVYLEKRKQLYGWSRRAEAVGIAALPPRRPTKWQRLEWEMSIIQSEDEQSNTNAES